MKIFAYVHEGYQGGVTELLEFDDEQEAANELSKRSKNGWSIEKVIEGFELIVKPTEVITRIELIKGI